MYSSDRIARPWNQRFTVIYCSAKKCRWLQLISTARSQPILTRINTVSEPSFYSFFLFKKKKSNREPIHYNFCFCTHLEKKKYDKQFRRSKRPIKETWSEPKPCWLISSESRDSNVSFSKFASLLYLVPKPWRFAISNPDESANHSKALNQRPCSAHSPFALNANKPHQQLWGPQLQWKRQWSFISFHLLRYTHTHWS